MFPVVFADADVLYSTTIRGWLFNLSVGEGFDSAPAFEVVTSEDVIAETVARWRDRNETAPGGVIATMADHLRTLCTVVRDYDCTIPFPGSDRGDIHVHAATVSSGAGYLITLDQGFHSIPDSEKDQLAYEIYHPDDFLMLANAQSSRRVLETVRTELTRPRPNGAAPELVQRLHAAGCPEFAATVDTHLSVLAGSPQPVVPPRRVRRHPQSQPAR